jgi:hypothetical protein
MNIRSEISANPGGTQRRGCRYILTQMEDSIMKKFGILVAAVIAAGVVAPTMASARTIIVKQGMHHHDRGFHHHDRKVVIVKHRH